MKFVVFFYFFVLSSLEQCSKISFFVLFVFSVFSFSFYALCFKFLCLSKFIFYGYILFNKFIFSGLRFKPHTKFVSSVFLSVFLPSFLLNVYKDFIDVSDVWRIGRNNFILEQWEEIFYITIICGAMWYDLLILPLSVARCDMTILYGY